MTTDDDLRTLEREARTDRAAASRLAFAYARLGRTTEAAELAFRVAVSAPDDPVRDLIPPSSASMVHDEPYSARCAPWAHASQPTRTRRVSLRTPRGTPPHAFHDAGRGVALIHGAAGIAAFDVLKTEFTWKKTERYRPLLTLSHGTIAVTEGNDPELVVINPRTGETRPHRELARHLATILDADLACLDARTLVALRSAEALVIDAVTGDVLGHVLYPAPTPRHGRQEEPRNLVVDPDGFTFQHGDETFSFTRTGALRWCGNDPPLGTVDGRCSLMGGGNTVVVSVETGAPQRELSAFTLEPLLVLRDVIVVTGTSLWAFDRVSLDLLWQRDQPPYQGYAATADQVLVQDPFSRTIRCVDGRTGRDLWIFELQRRRDSGDLLPSGDRLMLTAATGRAVIVLE